MAIELDLELSARVNGHGENPLLILEQIAHPVVLPGLGLTNSSKRVREFASWEDGSVFGTITHSNGRVVKVGLHKTGERGMVICAKPEIKTVSFRQMKTGRIFITAKKLKPRQCASIANQVVAAVCDYTAKNRQ